MAAVLRRPLVKQAAFDQPLPIHHQASYGQFERNLRRAAEMAAETATSV
jgi:hypothetical protein